MTAAEVTPALRRRIIAAIEERARQQVSDGLVRDVLHGWPSRWSAVVLEAAASLGVDVATVPVHTEEEVAAWKVRRAGKPADQSERVAELSREVAALELTIAELRREIAVKDQALAELTGKVGVPAVAAQVASALPVGHRQATKRDGCKVTIVMPDGTRTSADGKEVR